MSFSIAPDLADFIQGLPKTETHLHIEGALPWDFMRRIDAVKYAEPPDSWANDYKYNDFAHFEEHLLGLAFQWYTSPEKYHEAAKAIFAAHVAAGVRYVETSFASGVVEFLGLDGKAVCDAIVAAKPPELELRVFMGIHHSGFIPAMLPIIEKSLTWKNLTGLDLHGTETLPIDPITPRIWQEARDAGKVTKAHAGEFCGPDFVRYVMDELGITRIQHGVRAAEDPFLPKELAERGVILDVCPISNHKLVPGIRLENHPIRALFDAGVKVTISTDDPLTFGNTISEEYAVLHDITGFSRNELKQICRYGLENALVDDETKAAWLEEMPKN